MQQRQLNKLKEITKQNFSFVPADKNMYGTKYYEYKCTNDAEFHEIAGILNQYPNMFYTCIEHKDNTVSIAVLQNILDKKRIENIMWHKDCQASKVESIGKIHGNDIFLEQIPTQSGTMHNVINHSNRAVAIVNINGYRLPFYVSSGISGKETEYGIPSEKWYPLQGISDSGWLNKMPDMQKNPYPELDKICKILETKFPATKYKEMALNESLPRADKTTLLEYANSNFPEGTPFNENGLYQYYRNHIIYLPAIIDAWRSKPNDYLEISKGVLQISELNTLDKIRKLDLMANSSLEGDCIWLKPVQHQLKNQTDAETSQSIQNQLHKIGIFSHIFVSSDNKDGFGIPIQIFQDYFRQKQTQKFVNATQKIDKTDSKKDKSQNVSQHIMKRFKDLLDKYKR